jgi:hypothetical protein
MEANATTGKFPIGMTAILPLGKIVGKRNTWVITGWKSKYNGDGEQKITLKSEDGRDSDEMSSNKLLEEIARFEMENQSILYKRTDGGYDYKKANAPIKVVVEFDYTGRHGGFVSPYANVKVFIQGTQPLPATKPGVVSGRPTKEQELEAFL